jgi:HEAT repeat protein
MPVEKLISPIIAIAHSIRKTRAFQKFVGKFRDQAVDKTLKLFPAVRDAVTFLDKPEEDALNRASEMAYLLATIRLCEARLRGDTVSGHNSAPEREEKWLIEFIREQLLIRRNDNMGLLVTYVTDQAALLTADAWQGSGVANELKNRLVDRLIAELEAINAAHESGIPRMIGVKLPEEFERMIRQGWKETYERHSDRERDWFDLYCLYFHQELSKNQTATNSFQNKILAKILSNLEGEDLADQAAISKEIFEEISTSVGQQLSHIEKGVGEINRKLDEIGRDVKDIWSQLSPAGESISAESIEEIWRGYATRLQHTIDGIRIFGDNQLHHLDHVFVEPTINEEYERRPHHTEFFGLIDAELRRIRSVFGGADLRRGRKGSSDPDQRASAKVNRTIKPKDLLRRHTHAIITGAPGCGKTTLLRYLAWQSLRQWIGTGIGRELVNNHTKRLPVFLELNQLTEAAFQQSQGQLESLLFSKAITATTKPRDDAERDALKDRFFALLREGRVAIFLDGLDEISGGRFFRDFLVAVQEFLHSVYSGNTVIISTRPIALRQIGNLQTMEIQLLNTRQIGQFIERYCPEALERRRFKRELQIRRELSELARVPALLGFTLQLWRKNGGVADDKLQLYEQITLELARQLDGENEAVRDFMTPDDKRGTIKLGFLRHLAFVCLFKGITDVGERAPEEAGRFVFSSDTILAEARRFLSAWTGASINAIQGQPLDPLHLANDAKITAMLRQVGADHYAFAHVTLQEYLAAKVLAGKDDCERFFCRAYFNPTMAEMEVLPMTLGMVREPDRFYEVLEQLPESLDFKSLRLRARGVGWGARVRHSNLHQLINRLRGFILWQKRDETPYTQAIINSFVNAPSELVRFVVDEIRMLLKDKESDIKRRAAWVLGEIGGKYAVDALRHALEDQGNQELWSVARALGRTGSNGALLPLLKALKDEDHNLRWWAAEALGQIGSERAVPGLIDALKDNDRDVQGRAARSLGQIGGELALPYLTKALKDENPSVRMSAAEAMAQSGNEQAISELIKALNDEDFQVKLRASVVLKEIGSEKVISALVEALGSEDSALRDQAAEILGQVDREIALSALVDDLRSGNNGRIKRSAETLGQIGSEKAVSALTEALKSQDPTVRGQILESLGRIGGKQALVALNAALKDEDSDVRKRALTSLKVIGNEDAYSIMIEALKDEDPFVRSHAVGMLRRVDEQMVASTLIALLKSDEVNVRIHAVETLGVLGGEKATTALCAALADKNPDVRRRAMVELAKAGDDQAIAILCAGLKDEDSLIRSYAMITLAQIGNEQAISVLIGALKSEHMEIRFEAAVILRDLGSEQAISALLRALKDEDPSVQGFAAVALHGHYREHTLPAFVALLKGADREVRMFAIEALAEIKSRQAVFALLGALKNEDDEVAHYALAALLHIGEQAIPPLLEAFIVGDGEALLDLLMILGLITRQTLLSSGSDKTVLDLVEQLGAGDEKSQSQVALALALIAIAKLRQDDSIKFSPDLIEELKDDKVTRLNVAMAFGLTLAGAAERVNSARNVQKLIEAINSEDSGEKKRLIEAIGKFASSAAISALSKASKDKDTSVRLVAIGALGQIDNERGVPILLEALKDQAREVRMIAVETLGNIGGDLATLGLLETLTDEDGEVRWKSRWALGKIGYEPVVSDFILMLKSGSPIVRRKAAVALGEFGHETSTHALLEALEDEDDKVRYFAARSLGTISRDPTVSDLAVSALLEALAGEDREMRSYALASLGNFGSEKAVPALLEVLRGEDNEAQMLAAGVLGMIASEQSIPALIEALRDKDPMVQMLATTVFNRIGGEKSISALRQILKEEEGITRLYALCALCMMKSDQASSVLIEELKSQDGINTSAMAVGIIGHKKALSDLIECLSDEDVTVRERAVGALQHFTDEQAISALCGSLKDQNSGVRWRAAMALQQIGNEQAIPALIKALEHEDHSTRVVAAIAIEDISKNRAVSAFIETMKSEEFAVRFDAATALRRIGGEQTPSIWSEAFKSEHHDVRLIAVEELIWIGGDRAISSFTEALRSEKREVRWEAARALNRIGGSQAITAFINALESEYDDVRTEAVDALSQVGGGEAISALLEALQSEHKDLRWMAADALGQIGDEQAILPLVNALQDPDNGVRWHAAAALECIAARQQLANGFVGGLNSNIDFVRQKSASVVGYYADDEQIISLLAQLSTDSVPEVRDAARMAEEKFNRKLQYFDEIRTLVDSGGDPPKLSS